MCVCVCVCVCVCTYMYNVTKVSGDHLEFFLRLIISARVFDKSVCIDGKGRERG